MIKNHVEKDNDVVLHDQEESLLSVFIQLI